MKKLVTEYDSFFSHLDSAESYELVEGVGPVMISAPHSVIQTREGKPKYAEPWVVARMSSGS